MIKTVAVTLLVPKQPVATSFALELALRLQEGGYSEFFPRHDFYMLRNCVYPVYDTRLEQWIENNKVYPLSDHRIELFYPKIEQPGLFGTIAYYLVYATGLDTVSIPALASAIPFQLILGTHADISRMGLMGGVDRRLAYTYTLKGSTINKPRCAFSFVSRGLVVRSYIFSNPMISLDSSEHEYVSDKYFDLVGGGEVFKDQTAFVRDVTVFGEGQNTLFQDSLHKLYQFRVNSGIFKTDTGLGNSTVDFYVTV